MKRLGAICVGLVVAGWASQGQALTKTVSVANFAFTPADVSINVGDTIKWVWVSGGHTTTSGTSLSDPQAGAIWDQPITSVSQQYVRKFTSAGDFNYFCRNHPSMHGSVQVSAVTGIFEDLDEAAHVPRTALFQNIPNPFNASTLVGFSNRSAGHVQIAIYDILGRRVVTLVDGEFEPGSRLIEWDGKDANGVTVPSGVYFYRMSSIDGSETRKLVLLR